MVGYEEKRDVLLFFFLFAKKRVYIGCWIASLVNKSLKIVRLYQIPTDCLTRDSVSASLKRLRKQCSQKHNSKKHH